MAASSSSSSSMLNSSSATRDAMEAMQVIEEIANCLNTGLDKETLSICVRLIEQGINPTTLAHAVLDTQREAKRLSQN